MKLHQLPSTTTTPKKRPGRGYGSGKGGHTSTRGQKGQKSRSKIHTWFEGGQLPLSRRLPFLRGKDRFKSLSKNNAIITTANLESFKSGDTIDPKKLFDQKLITLKEASTGNIKVLARGKLSKPLTIQNLKVSKQAAKMISAAGGKIESPTKQ
ncbi:50S ribosomal protein L15 [Pseudomonadota bacterium]